MDVPEVSTGPAGDLIEVPRSMSEEAPDRGVGITRAMAVPSGGVPRTRDRARGA